MPVHTLALTVASHMFRLRAALAGALMLVCGAASARADTVISHNFECPDFTVGPLAGQQGWAAVGDVQAPPMLNATVGARSVRMTGPNPATQYIASRNVSGIPTAGQIITYSVDHLRSGADAGAGVSVGGNTGFIGQIFIGSTAFVGNTNSNTAPVPSPLGVWHRLVLTLNFVTNTMSGTIDGASMGAPIPINNPSPPTSIVQLQCYTYGSASVSEAYFDNVSLTTSLPTNDACANALPVSLGSTPYSTIGATNVGPAHPQCNVSGYDGIDFDIWYTFTAPAGGPVTASTCGATYDSKIAAYSGTCATLATSILACNDDTVGCAGGASSGLGSRITFNAVAGQSYLLRVGGFQGGTGAGTLVISQVSTGACCNRWTGNCTVRSQADCVVQGLRFDGFGAACSPATCKACPADFNGSGGPPAVNDIFAFLTAWFAGCP